MFIQDLLLRKPDTEIYGCSMACRTARALSHALRLLHCHQPASLQALMQQASGLCTHQAASLTTLHLFRAAPTRSFASAAAEHVLPANQEYEFVRLNNIAPAPGATKSVRAIAARTTETHHVPAEKAARTRRWHGPWQNIRTWAQGPESPFWYVVVITRTIEIARLQHRARPQVWL